MVDGAKTVVLHHPYDAKFLYPSGDRNAKSVFSMVDPRLDVETLEKTFPDFAKARPVAVTVDKGDVLYIPMGWWHDVRGHPGRNISINFWYRLHDDKISPDGLLQEFEDLYVAKRPAKS